jgi:hypothetical protein
VSSYEAAPSPVQSRH